jgi:hypothetical protein
VKEKAKKLLEKEEILARGKNFEKKYRNNPDIVFIGR